MKYLTTKSEALSFLDELLSYRKLKEVKVNFKNHKNLSDSINADLLAVYLGIYEYCFLKTEEEIIEAIFKVQEKIEKHI